MVNHDAPPDDDHGVALLEHRFWIFGRLSFSPQQQAAKLELAICDAGGLATGGGAAAE